MHRICDKRLAGALLAAGMLLMGVAGCKKAAVPPSPESAPDGAIVAIVPADARTPLPSPAPTPEPIALNFDGQTDITDALQQAIREAPEGAVLRLPAGTYAIGKTIVLRSGLTLMGAGMDATQLTVGAETLETVFLSENLENITLCDFSVTGGAAEVDNAVCAEGSRNITLQSLHLYDLRGGETPVAVFFQDTTDSMIRDCLFENISVDNEWGAAIRLAHGSSHNVVQDNTIRNTGRGGILCNNGSDHLTIARNVISGSGLSDELGGEGLSIELWVDCGYSVIEDNRVDRWISLDNSSYTAVRRNTIRNADGPVSPIGLETVGSCNIVLTDNRIDGGQMTGISASNTEPKEYAYWGGNRVAGCRQWGAQFQGETGKARYQYFYDLEISETFADREPVYPGDAGHAFRCNDNCADFLFENASFHGNEGRAIQLLGDVQNIRFLDADISGNGDDCAEDLAAMRITADALPKAAFSGGGHVKYGAPIAFSNASNGNTSPIAHVLWDFGTGVPSTAMNPTFTFETPGIYTITLIVWNEEGLAGRTVQTTRVS